VAEEEAVVPLTEEKPAHRVKVFGTHRDEEEDIKKDEDLEQDEEFVDKVQHPGHCCG